jgi:hypothetical protein
MTGKEPWSEKDSLIVWALWGKITAKARNQLAEAMGRTWDSMNGKYKRMVEERGFYYLPISEATKDKLEFWARENRFLASVCLIILASSLFGLVMGCTIYELIEALRK